MVQWFSLLYHKLNVRGIGSNPAFSVSFFFIIIILLLVFIPTCIAFTYLFFSLSGLAISPLQANCVGRWYHSVLGRPISLDNGRARAYCACSRYGWGQFGYYFFVAYHFSFPPPSVWGGWMTWFYVLFNRISVISGRWVGDGWLCAMEISFTIEKILTSSGARIRDH